QGRIRHVLHRLFPPPRGHRTNAAQHVPRRSSRQHRPHPSLLHRDHRRTVLLPHRRLPRRSTTAAEFIGRDTGAGHRAREWLVDDRQSERNPAMNNLYRDLAPITEEAWNEIELEATRTFKRHIAGRRVVDVSEPGGPTAAAISTGRLLDVQAPTDGVI